MAINIKNEQVCSLVREAAARTGQPQVSVIETAMRRYLEQMRQDNGAVTDRADEILARIDETMTPDDAAAIRSELDSLFDEDGLPG